MFNKVFKRGRGRASGIDYLLSPMDAQKKIRTPPAVLMRGDPILTKGIIHDLSYAQKYTSGVLSWEESPGQISTRILENVMDSFEAMVGTGLEDDQINILWVLHQDKNRIELHWIVPNCDLQSGKRFSPYYDKVDRNRFRAWERYTNAFHGFTDPSDPTKKRDLRLPSTLPREKARAIEDIHTVISAMVAQGIVTNRDDIVRELQSVGYKINRQAEDYLSIQDDTGRKLRLRGSLYESSFTSIENIRGAKPIGTKESEADRTERISQLRATLELELEKRCQYIEKRFHRSHGTSHRESDQSTTLATMPDVGVIDDRSTEFVNAVPPSPRERDNQARGSTDNAIHRVASAVGDVEQTAASVSSRLNAIEQKFGAFLKRAELVLRALGRKINESGIASSATHNTKTLN